MKVPFLALLTCLLLTGCQCCSLTERYCDKVDEINDSYPTFDSHYHARWDLTRIGRQDWCRSRLNRWWCGKSCDQCRTFHPPYVSQFEVHSMNTGMPAEPAMPAVQQPYEAPSVMEPVPPAPAPETGL